MDIARSRRDGVRSRRSVAVVLVGGLACVLIGLIGVVPSARAREGIGQLEVAKFAIETGLFNAIFAKEICSCIFVDGLSLDECKARDNLPKPAHLLYKIEVDASAKTVRSRLNLAGAALVPAGVTPGPMAAARLVSPALGCRLISTTASTP